MIVIFRTMRSIILHAILTVTVSLGFSVPVHFGHHHLNYVTQLQSIPNSIDIVTSGLASMACLQRGVSVSPNRISLAGPAAPYLPKIKKLYDVENSRDCRAVRERITELDLVIEQVIPAASNSRAVSNGPITVPTMVAEMDGSEKEFVGALDILDFLSEKFSTVTEKEIKEKELDTNGDGLKVILDNVIVFGTFLPGLLRFGRGSNVCSAASSSFNLPRPQAPLVLYSYEGNQFCRLVREVLTELDLVYELRSAGKGSPRRNELANASGGSSQCPYFIDSNTGVKIQDSKDIISYLYKTYALWTPPNELLQTISAIITPLLKPLYRIIAPLQAGSYRDNEFEYNSDIAEAKASIYEEISSEPVVIYTYEYSPFCSEATALLENCGIKFREISLGLEWIPGLIREPAKRNALLEITGQSSLPHVFVGGISIGGLFTGSPGLVPSLERGQLMKLVEDAKIAIDDTKKTAIS